MYYPDWDRISRIVTDVSRDDVYRAVTLARRLIGMNDERLLRILGDYENEEVYNTSIKGMLFLILLELQQIRNNLTDINAGVNTIRRYSKDISTKPNKRWILDQYYHIVSYLARYMYQPEGTTFWYPFDWQTAGGYLQDSGGAGGADGSRMRIPTPLSWTQEGVVLQFQIFVQLLRGGNDPIQGAKPQGYLYAGFFDTVPIRGITFDWDNVNWGYVTYINPYWQDQDHTWLQIFFDENENSEGDTLAVDIMLVGNPT